MGKSHILAFVGLIMSFTSQASLAGDASVQDLMRKKLECAHGLLDGLVREDYAAVAKNAEMLGNIGRATTWYKRGDPDFLSRARAFQSSADFLASQAHDKNLEGVAIGYMRLTLDCMQCHNFVRAGRTK